MFHYYFLNIFIYIALYIIYDLSKNNEDNYFIYKICKGIIIFLLFSVFTLVLYGVKVFQQFSPVTLYLGDGQLEEVKEHFTAVASSPNVTSGQNLTQQLQSDATTVHSQVNLLVYCSYHCLMY